MEIFGLDAWLSWFLIGIGLLIVEVAIAFTFFAAPIALGCFAAAIVAAAGGSLELQLVGLIIGALLSLVFLRPVVLDHLQPPAPEKSSNVQSLIGRRAVTLERVDADTGTVRLGDDVWSARSESEDLVIPEGSRVEVVEIRGVYVFVRPSPAASPAEAGKESGEDA